MLKKDILRSKKMELRVFGSGNYTPWLAMETDVERKAGLEKMIATTQLRLALETEEEKEQKKE